MKYDLILFVIAYINSVRRIKHRNVKLPVLEAARSRCTLKGVTSRQLAKILPIMICRFVCVNFKGRSMSSCYYCYLTMKILLLLVLLSIVAGLSFLSSTVICILSG